MTPSAPAPEYGETVFDSSDVPLIELSDADGTLQVVEPKWTPATLLNAMRERVRYYGAPLPEGFVAPPGIDLDALLKQVPWPPAEDR